MKKKIIIDLDVITVALWDSKGKNTELARKFLTRVGKKEFFVKNSDRLITDTEIKEKCEELNVNYELILKKLESAGIKSEDAALVLITSLFSFDYLITFNRIHLKNKKEEANKILKECNLPTIQIVDPEEI